MGGRGKSNEFDLTLLCRFGYTQGMYYVSRSDSLFALDHFLGGYIGLDYSHYFFQAAHWEAGLTEGVATMVLISLTLHPMTTVKIT